MLRVLHVKQLESDQRISQEVWMRSAESRKVALFKCTTDLSQGRCAAGEALCFCVGLD